MINYYCILFVMLLDPVKGLGTCVRLTSPGHCINDCSTIFIVLLPPLDGRCGSVFRGAFNIEVNTI